MHSIQEYSCVRMPNGNRVAGAPGVSRRSIRGAISTSLAVLVYLTLLSLRAACQSSPEASQAPAVTPYNTSINSSGNVFLTAGVLGSTSNGPNSVATADFNGDGKVDIVTTMGDNQVNVFLGNGDGTFQAPKLIATSCGSDYVAVGDFNGDGKPDLAISNPGCGPGTNGVLILLGNGDGTFTSKGTLVAGLSNPFGLVTGDFNGDGKLDLAVVDRGSGTDSVFFFFGNGDGTFQAPVTVSLSGLFNSYQIVAADFNKDGHLDVAVSEITGTNVAVILGNGNGTFQAPRSFALPGQGYGIAVGDFNGDGVPDLVATTPANGGVTVLLGAGNGSFTAVNNPQTGTTPTAFAAAPNEGCQPVAVGDFNKDGKLDIIAGLSGVNGSATLALLTGNGDGTFQPETLFSTVDFAAALAVADFNGDGNPDWVVAGNQANLLVVGLGRGDGTFLAGRDFVPGNGPQNVALADFNKDGKLDVVSANLSSSNVSIMLGNGDGTFQPPTNLAIAGTVPTSVLTGDFNGDGNSDVIAFNGPGGFVAPCLGTNLVCMTVYLGKGDGTFNGGTVLSTGATNVYSAVAGDFNGDGKQDLALLASADQGNTFNISMLFGKGDGTFQAPVLLSITTANIPYQLLLSDVNKDGKLDLLIAEANAGTHAGDFQVWLGKGDGTFQELPGVSTCRTPALLPPSDFNEDGKLDVVAFCEFDQDAQFFPGNADGTFNAPSLINLGPTNIGPPQAGAVADFNLDGHLDFVYSRGGNNQGTGFGLLLGNGNGTFQPEQEYLTTSAFASFINAVADLNGDGTPDLVLVNPAESVITVLLNQTPPPISVSPSSLSFGNQLVSTTSSAQMIKVSNNGAAAATVSASASGDFAQTSNCPVSPATLAPSSNCNVSATFKPTATGIRNGSVTVTDSLPGSPQSVALTGTGVAPIATLGAGSIPFGNQVVGTSSAPQGVSLTNTGTAPLASLSITIAGANSGDYSQTNNCGASLAVNANCSINVTFKPTASGIRTANVSISDDASNSPQSVSLTGTGVAPVATLSGALNYTSQPVGTSSASQSVTLTNTGNAPLTISSITLTGADSGDFSQTNNCPVSPSTLAANAACTVMVSFTPTATGTRTASVTFTDNASSSPQSVSLTGTGAADSPVAALSTTTLPFGNQLVTTTSAAQRVTLTNTGNVALTISGITVTGANSAEFAETNTCGGSLAVNANCQINVTFTPATTGAKAASVSIADNAANSPQIISLTGTGVAPAVTLSTNTLPFAGQLITTSSAAQSVTVTNSGTAPLTITSIAVSGANSAEFAQTNNCPAASASLAPAAKCTINVTFTPAAVGARAATLSLTDNASGSPHTVALSGTGTDFAIAAATGANCPQGANCTTSSTIAAGQTATYALQISPVDGFNGVVALSCGGAPATTTCGVSPISVPPNGSASYAFSVTVSNTSSATNTPLTGVPRVPATPRLILTATLSILFLLTFVMKLARSAKRVKWALASLTAVLLLGAFCGVGCAGGSSGPPPPPSPTNAVLIVTGVSNQVNRTLNLSLTINH